MLEKGIRNSFSKAERARFSLHGISLYEMNLNQCRQTYYLLTQYSIEFMDINNIGDHGCILYNIVEILDLLYRLSQI